MLKSRCVLILIVLLNLLVSNSLFGQSKEVKKMIRAYSIESNPTKRFWKLNNLANHYKKYDFKKADSIRSSLLTLSYSANDSARYVASVFDAEMDLMNGNTEQYYNKVLDLQSFNALLPSKYVKIDLYLRLANYHVYKREADQARVYINEALLNAKKLRNNTFISKIYGVYALQCLLKNQKDSAQNMAIESIQFARRSAKKNVLSEAFNIQARVYEYFGQLELSVSKNMIALQLANEISDSYLIAKYSNEIGKIQIQIKNYKEAELYFLSAIDNANKIKDEHLLSISRVNLALVNMKTKKYDKALSMVNEAIILLESNNDNDGLGNAYNVLGDAYMLNKDYAKALSNYNKSLVYFEAIGNQEMIATVYHNVGFAFEQQGKYGNALNYLNRSLKIREQFAYKGAVYPTYQTISNVYNKTGNKILAYKYLKLYSDYADSAKTLESSAKIAELSELYRSEQRERFISLQSDSIERQRQEKALTSAKIENIELKNNLQAYVIIAFLIFMLLAGIIGFYRWNQTKIKQQQQQIEMQQTLLRSQMNPHFVFNAMSVIQSYIYENDTKNSSKFLLNFSKLMRLILENSPKEFIPITTEKDILERYLSVQKLRFEDRFNFKITMQEELFDEEAVIPPMITQPFIENAIEHGRLHLKDDGFIHVTFTKQIDMLKIVVEDNGIGRKEADKNKKSKDHKSMAMKITKDRIEILNKKYRSLGELIIEDFNKEKEFGTKVTITIPYRMTN